MKTQLKLSIIEGSKFEAGVLKRALGLKAKGFLQKLKGKPAEPGVKEAAFLSTERSLTRKKYSIQGIKIEVDASRNDPKNVT